MKKQIDRLIRWSSRVTGLDVAYYLKGGFWLFTGHIASTLLTLAIIMGFTWLAPSRLLGQYQFVLSILAVLSIFSLTGMNTAIIQSVSSGKPATLVRATKFRLKTSFLGSAASLATAFYLFSTANDTWPVFILAAAIFPLLHSFDGYLSFFVGKGMFKRASKSNITAKFFPAVVTLAVIVATQDLFYIIAAFLLSTAFMHILLYLKTKPLAKGRGDKEISKYGTHLTAMQVVQVIAIQIDKLLLAYFLGFEALALYVVAIILPEGSKGFMKLGSLMLFPKLTKIKSIPRQKVLLSVLTSVAIAAIGVVLAPILIPILFTQKFAGAAIYAQILFISLAFGIPSTIFVYSLQSKKKVRGLYIYNFVSPTIRILAILALIPYGILGISIAIVIARFSTFLLLGYENRSLIA